MNSPNYINIICNLNNLTNVNKFHNFNIGNINLNLLVGVDLEKGDKEFSTKNSFFP